LTIIIPANSAADTAYDVDNSCRFNNGDGAYMHKTPGSNGNAKTWTLSFWWKRGVLSTGDQSPFIAHEDGGNYVWLRIDSGDKLDFLGYESAGGADFNFETTQVFRDPSAWQHIVVAFDTTQGTEGNRVKIYVNGTQVTSFGAASYPTLNYDSVANQTTSVHVVGVGDSGPSYVKAANHFDGYLAEVCWVDGTAYAASDFGEFDEDSPTIWKPIDVSGLTFGTNGFYCDFEDSANLGNDANGGTDLTEVNLAATDQSSDTPTLNYPTFNPLIKGNVATTLSEGNLKGVFGSGWSWLPATFGVQNGKWYWEAKVSATNDANLFIGITTEDQDWDDATPYDEAGTILYFADGRKSVDGTDTESHFASYTTNDIIGVALDLDSGTRTITFYKNNSVTPASSSAVTITSNFTGKFIMPVFVGNSSSAAANWELNFGSPPYANTSDAADANGYGAFEFAPPSGYIALNSKNLGSDGG